jgi:hypothetical protein
VRDQARNGRSQRQILHDPAFARLLAKTATMSVIEQAKGIIIAWLIEDGSRPHPFRLGEKRLGTFGSLPVRGGSGPVQ